MKNLTIKCGSIEISNANKFCLIAGPCQLETEQHALDISGKIKDITSRLGINFIYKTSFDKANRTSIKGKRGAGLEKSLPVFDKIKKELNVPILNLSDISLIFPAISMACCSDSNWHGPAIKEIFLLFEISIPLQLIVLYSISKF